MAGLALSLCCVQETLPYAQLEGRLTAAPTQPIRWAEVVRLVSWGDRRLFAISQAGLVNNLNDTMVWGLLPLWLSAQGAVKRARCNLHRPAPLIVRRAKKNPCGATE